MKTKFYLKLWFKNILFIGLPTIISILGVLISFLDQKYSQLLIFSILFLMICLIISVVFYSNQEDKMNKELKELTDKNKSLNTILFKLDNLSKTNAYIVNAFSECAESWSKNLNTFANEVKGSGKVSEKCWDKIKLYDTLCVQCRDTIKKYCGKDDNSKVSVGFISYTEDKDGTAWVKMIAHSNPESTRPHSFGKLEKLAESRYYYADLIKENNSNIDLAVNNEEILRKFKNVSLTTDLSKYTQYIGIPVYCSSKKRLGIFQVVTKYEYIIEKDRVSLEKFATDFIIPYINLIILIDKINKGLYVKPIEIK